MEKDYTEVYRSKRAYFDRGETRSYAFRKARLTELRAVIRAWEGRITDALHRDLGKSPGEAYTTEIGVVYSELNMALENLKSWMKPRSQPTPLALAPSESTVHPVPRGVVLIIAPWNYPFNLSMAPLIGALAAGNTAVLKPSEEAPATAAVLEEMLGSIFDPGYVEVVQGPGHEVVPALMRNGDFNHIFFTGSTAVGREIAKMAAEQLASTTLELGGKSPAIVDTTANLRVAAKRLAWGKFTNAGQTCICPDYLLVSPEIKAPLLAELKKATVELYGENPGANGSYARVINRKRFDTLAGYLDGANILHGGQMDAEKLYLAPTIIDGVDMENDVMKAEIFGPILPILTFETPADLMEIVRQNPYPLALYYFGKDKSMQKLVTERLEFGGGCINNTLVHAANPHLPFGGIRYSGTGHYHGKYGFDTFSHLKGIVHSRTFPDPSMKYPPYTEGKMKWIRKLLG